MKIRQPCFELLKLLRRRLKTENLAIIPARPFGKAPRSEAVVSADIQKALIDARRKNIKILVRRIDADHTGFEGRDMDALRRDAERAQARGDLRAVLARCDNDEGAGEGLRYARPLAVYRDGSKSVYTDDMRRVYDDFSLDHLF